MIRLQRSVLLLATAFWVWCAFITFGAGFLGALLNCEGGCSASGSVEWAKPWTLGGHDVFPEVFFIALAGLLCASVFAVGVVQRQFIPAVAAFVATATLLTYPFFAGLTSEGQRLYWFGPLIGVAALVNCRSDWRALFNADG
jgi:hypothetical protein